MAYPQVSITFEREQIPVHSFRPDLVPDEKWRYLDQRGHGHWWNGTDLPTLEWVVTGTESIGDEYSWDEIEVGEYRCRLCGEVVEPAKREVPGPDYIPGLVTVTVSIDGESFLLTQEEYARSLEQWAGLLRGSAA
jgi:hypothetical protein